MAIWIIKHLLNLTSFSLQTKQCHCNEHIKQTQIGRLTKRAKLLLSHRLTLKKIACERSSKFVHKTRKYNNKSIWVGRDRAKITIIQRQTHRVQWTTRRAKQIRTHKHCFHSFDSRRWGVKSSHRQRENLRQRCLLLRDVVISHCAGVINSSPSNLTLREHCVCMQFSCDSACSPLPALDSVWSFVLMSKL